MLTYGLIVVVFAVGFIAGRTYQAIRNQWDD